MTRRRSKASQKLSKNLKDLQFLLEIHTRETGERKGRRGPKANVLNRAGIVLGCAAWEAYVEDVCTESFDFLRKKILTEKAVPNGVKYAVVEKIKQQDGAKEVSYWKLVDERYRRDIMGQAVRSLVEDFHTPSCKNIDELFVKCVGIRDLMKTLGRRASRLDTFVQLRHEIAHGTGVKRVYKKKVEDLRSLLEASAEKVDALTADHIEKLLRNERKELEEEAKRRPGRKTIRRGARRGRPEVLRPW